MNSYSDNLMVTDCKVCGVVVMRRGGNIPDNSCYCTHLNFWKSMPGGILAVFGEVIL